MSEWIHLERTAKHLHVQFDRPSPVVSSAVLNGGVIEADHILNLSIRDQFENGVEIRQSPEASLAEYSRRRGWSGTVVGLMTAASMDSFRLVQTKEQGVDIYALVTTGLSNARRAGDYAEHREIAIPRYTAGTINIICLTTARLTPAAMLEAVITATEAKSAALQNLGIKSPVSGMPATGTGTDAIAVACGHGSVEVRFCGKHVIFGEMLANVVIEAVTASVKGTEARRRPGMPLP